MNPLARLLAGVLLFAGPAAPLAAQSLDSAALEAGRAWQVHDMAGLVEAPRTLIQLPGADPSAPVGRDQAVALLREYVRGSTEVETRVRAAREVGPGRGFVELVRRYRVAGTQQVRSESVLLGYVRTGGKWVLSEVRIAG